MEQARRLDRTRLLRYRPYAKQREFHANGAGHRERLLMAGNQLGKTFCGAAEAAIHLTGLYPDWWTGWRSARPIRMWAGSKTSEVTRDTCQRYLVGEPADEATWGTGMIPADRLLGWDRKSSSAPNALDNVTVKHTSGGTSKVGFKAYDQGREKWQGETLDAIWMDEEPPLELYMEAITRTNAALGPLWITFTPLLGFSAVVRMFLEENPL